ncbi:MAG: GxxExxY protein [Luteimonas sp.]
MSQRVSAVAIGCAIEVHRELGHGFLERVYEEALAIELRVAGLVFEQQKAFTVWYRDKIVGEYCCDFVVGGQLILELKALSTISAAHEAQVLNYLKASRLSAGLLLNFGANRLGVKRFVLNHDDKTPV